MHAANPTPTPARAWTWGHARDAAVLTAVAILGPFVIHAIPGWDDTPLGARLIPAFYAPLLAVLWRQYGFAVALAIASPWINHLLFGMPARHLAVLLTFELVVFTALAAALARTLGRQAWLGPLAYLLTKPFSAGFIATTHILPAAPLEWVARSVTIAIPGVVVLALLGLLARHPPEGTA